MSNMILFLQNGGAFMYPIAFILVIGLAIALERFLFLSRFHFTNKMALKVSLPHFKKNDLTGLKQAIGQRANTVAYMVQSALTLIHQSKDRDAITNALEERILEATPLIEKRTPYLATLANVATLLGLLGTIMGLIDAFTSLSGAEASERAALLSSSISVAMNTTAFGLMTAIPLLLIHTFLQSKTNQIIDTFDIIEAKCLSLVNSKD